MRLDLDRSSSVPLGTQLTRLLATAIETGELEPGERLPSLRDAAAAAGVNVNTVRAAYAKLEAAGLVASEQGRGTFVAAPAAGADQRRALREEIARLEAELVSLPLLPRAEGSPRRRPAGGRLLSVDELESVRDLLADRVAELHAAREEIVRRLEADRREPVGRGDPPPPSEAPAVRAPARRSSSSVAGVRVRWT